MQTDELKEYDAVSPTNGRGLVVPTSFDHLRNILYIHCRCQWAKGRPNSCPESPFLPLRQRVSPLTVQRWHDRDRNDRVI